MSKGARPAMASARVHVGGSTVLAGISALGTDAVQFRSDMITGFCWLVCLV